MPICRELDLLVPQEHLVRPVLLEQREIQALQGLRAALPGQQERLDQRDRQEALLAPLARLDQLAIQV